MSPITIRPAAPPDVPLILGFLRKKAVFDRETGGFTGEIETTPERILTTLFDSPPYAHALIAEVGGAPRGFALYYFRYSSFMGLPNLWLDDLYVDADVRSAGVGAAVLARLSAIAADHRCTHLGWTASVNNPRGIAFYERAGASVVERTDVRVTFRWPVVV